MNKRSIAAFALITICLMLFPDMRLVAQTKISVKVTNTENKLMEFVPVLLLSCTDTSLIKGGLTDSLGRFASEAIHSSCLLIAISNIGYKSFLKKIEVRSDTLISVKLESDTRTLTGVTIVSKNALIEKKIDRLVFNVDGSAFAMGNSVWEVLKKAPGVISDEQGNIRIKATQGATVLINDRKIYLSGEELMSLLKSMNADDVSKIEIITNPSAKYDAEGGGGVVNIILKKDIRQGLNGSLHAGYEQTIYGKFNGGLGLNYRSLKTNVYGSLNARQGKYFKSETLQETYSDASHISFYKETINSKSLRTSGNYVLGIDHSLNANHSLGILAEGTVFDKQGTNSNDGVYQNASRQNDSTLYTNVESRNKSYYTTFNLNYKGKLDTLGKSVQVNLDYVYYDVPLLTATSTTDVYGGPSEAFLHRIGFENSTVAKIQVFAGKADYSQTLFSKVKADVGVKLAATETQNTVHFLNENPGFPVSTDTGKSNSFHYSETIASAYASFSSSLKKIDWQAGLRAEDTHAIGSDKMGQALLKRDYIELFPSLFLQYNQSNDYQYGIVFNRRVNRPSFSDLNPFRYYINPYSYTEGNPFLQPSFVNAFDGSVSVKNKWFFDVFCNLIQAQFSQVIIPEPSTNSNRYLVQNIDHSYDYGVSVASSLSPYKWWDMNSSVIAKINGSQSQFLGSSYRYQSAVLFLITSQVFTLSEPGHLQLELNGTYMTPGTVQGLFQLGSMLDVSVGIRKQFLHRKASLALVVTDIFRGTYITAKTEYLGQKSFVNGNYDQQGIRLAFTYKFGRQTIEKNKNRDTGDTDEKNRIKQ
jgi:hypothetical protein